MDEFDSFGDIKHQMIGTLRKDDLLNEANHTLPLANTQRYLHDANEFTLPWYHLQD